MGDALVQSVMGRVSDVTRTPQTNGEFAQLVYYHACPAEGDASCAFYRRHSDYIEADLHHVQGVRIYTLFMYLNDVEEGGGTRFTDLPGGPLTFQPQRGKAILWPSVLAEAPDQIDPRTHHEALPVTKGEKFGTFLFQYTIPHLGQNVDSFTSKLPPLYRCQLLDSPVRLQDATCLRLHNVTARGTYVDACL